MTSEFEFALPFPVNIFPRIEEWETTTDAMSCGILVLSMGYKNSMRAFSELWGNFAEVLQNLQESLPSTVWSLYRISYPQLGTSTRVYPYSGEIKSEAVLCGVCGPESRVFLHVWKRQHMSENSPASHRSGPNRAQYPVEQSPDVRYTFRSSSV